MPVVGKHRAAPGIERGIVFEHPDRGLDRVERASPAPQDRTSRFERRVQSGQPDSLFRRVQPQFAAAAVHHQFPVHHSPAFARTIPLAQA